MNNPSKWFRWPLAVILIVSIFMLAACKSKSSQADATASKSTPVATSALTPLSTQVSTPASTATPYILAGATTTASGLQYLEEKAGNGASPQVGDVIKMNYIHFLLSGRIQYS